LISVVTVSKDSARTIADTVRSVMHQSGVSVEHIIKDAGSTDSTLEIVKALNPGARVIVSQDRGIYDAMNQGFEATQGGIVGFLNSDDYYSNESTLSKVRAAFESSDVHIVYGDISIINGSGKEIRCWRAGPINKHGLSGRQLPHPAVFIRRSTLSGLNPPFDPSYRIAADFKQQLILIDKMGLRAVYIPQVLAVMRAGGESSRGLGAVWRGWVECARAHKEVGNRLPWMWVALKVFSKLRDVRFYRVAAR
jgi:glycosyltransferase